MKSPWHGKTWNGNELKKIMKNISQLENNRFFPEDLKVFLNAFKYLIKLDKGVSGRLLDPNWEPLIDDYCGSFHILHNQLI